MRQDIAKDQVLVRSLGRAIKESLREGKQQQAEEVGVEVETRIGLDHPLHR